MFLFFYSDMGHHILWADTGGGRVFPAFWLWTERERLSSLSFMAVKALCPVDT